ncbi:integrase catalytic domain-containing protein [Trichonephila clavata]|uniref:Integrase catalytic domain-containing protein n=1 Tax=Trichonephila clavata TaxID=2740835 RepID=A0A8X6KRR5_TRICU|nr:integrase catalytic domain-containing protein [Trichonephila clavata]
MESSSKLGRRATKFSSKTMENISRATASSYKKKKKKIKIPRCILIPQAIDVQVHGFCDSSEKAYCAAIYIRSKDTTQTVIARLLTSKTRVSPVKPQSLTRLELYFALLLANLLHATLPTLTVPISEIFAWSDSKITLAWLKSEPREDGNRS